MEMTKDWEFYLAENNIKFEETDDKIIFYVPNELSDGLVVIREHLKHKKDIHGYSSHRIGTITMSEFNKKFNIS